MITFFVSHNITYFFGNLKVKIWTLTTFYIQNTEKPEWRISITKLYKPYSNKMMYNVDCWACNSNGIIIKRSSLTDVTTTLELQKIIDLCRIDYKVIK